MLLATLYVRYFVRAIGKRIKIKGRWQTVGFAFGIQTNIMVISTTCLCQFDSSSEKNSFYDLIASNFLAITSVFATMVIS